MILSRRDSLLLIAGAMAEQVHSGFRPGAVQVGRRLPSAASEVPFGATFVDVAQQAGLRKPTVYGGIDRKKYILEANGCGCAFIDYDNDGWIDIFLLSGTRLAGAPPEAGNRLYKNNRDGTFTDVTDKAGLGAVGWANGVCVGDYNNDGFEDLFCTFYGENRLYRNNGDGTFTDVTVQSGLLFPDTVRWGAGCSFLDYDRDGHLDLFVSNYIDYSLEHAPVPGRNSTCNWKGVPVNCGPRGLPTTRHLLFHNNGDGTFSDVSKSSGIWKAAGTYGMTVMAADFDEDGWTDIFVACDSTPSLLFMNNRDGTFREEGVSRGVALSGDGMEQAGMGVGLGDFNCDGHLDIFKTHFTDDSCGLFRNDGTGNFDDVSKETMVGRETRYTGWGTGMVDLDNDGNPDLVFVTGSVYPEVEKVLPQYPYKSPIVLFQNQGSGLFREMAMPSGSKPLPLHSSRGCAFGDIDNDGDVDILVINMNEPPSLLRNDVIKDRHWMKVKLEGVKSNRSAIGARVIVHYGGKRQAQSVTSQASYYSCNDFRLHFGLGSVKTADVEVYWPNGLHEVHRGLAADQLITLREGNGRITSKGFQGP